MDGINSIIFDNVKPNLADYQCDPDNIERFFNATPDDRNKIAITVMKNAMSTHQKGDLFEFVSELNNIQQGAFLIQERLRDHVSHSVFTFLLGIYLLDHYFERTHNVKVSPLQWKLAGLFHDIAYPVEIATTILSDYIATINRIKSQTNTLNIPPFQISLDGFKILTNDINGLQLIQNCSKKWGINTDITFEYTQMLKSGHSNHGIIGALSLLNVIDSMYQSNNENRLYTRCVRSGTDWNQKYFDEDIVPACTAIYLHNFDIITPKIDIQKAPLAFLLILCDCLQEWERPKQNSPTGLASAHFNISIENGKIIFVTPNNELKENIKTEIYSRINAPFVEVVNQ